MPIESLRSASGTERGSATTGKFPALHQALLDAGNEIIERLKKSATDKGLDASGRLIAGIDFNVKVFATQYRWQLTMPDYYKDVDEGTKPHLVPIKDLIEWITFKGIAPKLRKKGFGKNGKKSAKSLGYTKQDTAKSLAYMIQQSILKKGTIKRFGYKGSKFYSSVVTEQWLGNIQAKLAKAAKKDVLIEIKYFNK